MATINPTGMGYKTARQYHRVADDMKKYARSLYNHHNSNATVENWYYSHSTMKDDVTKHTTNLYTTQLSTLYSTQLFTHSLSTLGRHY